MIHLTSLEWAHPFYAIGMKEIDFWRMERRLHYGFNYEFEEKNWGRWVNNRGFGQKRSRKIDEGHWSDWRRREIWDELKLNKRCASRGDLSWVHTLSHSLSLSALSSISSLYSQSHTYCPTSAAFPSTIKTDGDYRGKTGKQRWKRKGQLWCHNIHFKETSEPLFVSKTSRRKPSFEA